MVLAILRVPLLLMPPPLLDAELPEKVELVMVRLLLLRMPPPLLAELLERVELVRVRRVPLL